MPNFSVVVYAVQGDVMSREVTALLYDGQTPFTPSVGALGTVRFLKPDGTSGFYDTMEDDETVAVTWEGNEATIRLAEQVLTAPGDVIVQVSFYNSDAERLSTFNFKVVVEKNPLTDEEFESTDYYSVLTARIAAVLNVTTHAPQINSLNHWVLWDDEAQDYYDSGVNATGPQGPQGEQGEQGEPGRDGQGAPGSSLPLMNGTASAGTQIVYSREDHVHPKDTSKLDAADFVLSDTDPLVDGTASPGTSTEVSRADHVHPMNDSYIVKEGVTVYRNGKLRVVRVDSPSAWCATLYEVDRPSLNASESSKIFNGSTYIDCRIQVGTDGAVKVTDYFGGEISGAQYGFLSSRYISYFVD